MTLSKYVLKRNGVPLGAKGSLLKNLENSFGAESNVLFWKYWNPIWVSICVNISTYHLIDIYLNQFRRLLLLWQVVHSMI